jgi:hypothetical protein
MERAFEGIDSTFLLKNGGVLGGAAILTFLSLNLLKRGMGNEEYSQLKDLISESQFDLLRKSEWIEILFKFYDFYALNPALYLKLLQKVIKFLYFKEKIEEIKLKNHKTRFGIPRISRNYLHPIIECIREMRYSIEKQYGTIYLNDFDELASEIQNIHNSCATNILLDT